MKKEFFTETTRQPLFTVFDSVKSRKVNMFRRHSHAELELGFITGGEGTYLLENETFDVKPGDLFLVRPNEQHCIPTITTPELSSFNIHVQSCYLWTVCADYIDAGRIGCLISAQTPIRHHWRGEPEILAVIERMRKLTETEEDDRFAVRRELLGLIELLCDRLDAGEAESFRPTASHLADVQNAILYIDSHLTESLTLESIARAANLSRSHLSAMFKQVTGITPYEYLLLQRIDRAVGMLRGTDRTVSTVAEECGFGSLANFNRAFRKVTGMTPRDYRSSRLGQ